jgi:histidinol-phosphate/aromatic aminotransferase/cobyric acid decarboxylase-like protein
MYESLKRRKILVRYMNFPEIAWSDSGRVDGLRITVGTDEEIDTLLAAMKDIAEEALPSVAAQRDQHLSEPRTHGTGG